MPGVISPLQQNHGSINLNLKLNTNKSWTTRECMRGLKVNTEPKVMKAPVAISELVKVPLSPKVVNTVKAIEKEGHCHLAGTPPPAQAGQQQQLPHLHSEDITPTLNKQRTLLQS